MTDAPTHSLTIQPIDGITQGDPMAPMLKPEVQKWLKEYCRDQHKIEGRVIRFTTPVALRHFMMRWNIVRYSPSTSN